PGFVAWLKRPKQVRQLLPGRSVSQARSNTTINLYLTGVSGFYDYLFRTEQINKNPNDQLAGPHRNRPYKGFLHHAAPKLVTTNILAQAVARRKRPTTISKEQVEQLRAACECRRDRALVRLIFETGLRPGEVLALWLEDVNIGELHIDVRDRGELVNLAEIKRPSPERLQVRAGHRHFQTTMDHYVHPSQVRLRQAWEASRASMTLNAAQEQR